MGVRLLFLLGPLGLASSAGAALPGWTFRNLSELLPDQPRFPATRWDSAPSAQAEGVAWLAYNPMVTRPPLGGNAIAYWDGSGVSYLTPYPPDWSWAGVCKPSACGTDVAFPLVGIWPPDAGPNDPHYVYTEMFYLDDQGLHRITHDQASEHALPSLDGGTIAWQTRRAWSQDWEIYFWDGGTIRRITDNDVHDTDASLFGRTIAWCSGGDFPWRSGADVVYLSVPPPGDPRPLPPPTVVGPGAAPCLFKNKIAYHASDGQDMEIFLHDIQSGVTLQITDNEYDDRNPSLYDGTIAWQSAPTDRDNANIFYWDGSSVHKLTDDPWFTHVNPSLWGRGLNTTIAYVQVFSGIQPCSRVVCARRDLLSVAPGPSPSEITITWPSFEGRTYRVEYSDDLLSWHIAADDLPSAGYGETSWTDDGSKTGLSPSLAPRRFYRVSEEE